jgi:hypothetical protein
VERGSAMLANNIYCGNNNLIAYNLVQQEHKKNSRREITVVGMFNEFIYNRNDNRS